MPFATLVEYLYVYATVKQFRVLEIEYREIVPTNLELYVLEVININ